MATARLRLNLLFITWHRRAAPIDVARFLLTVYRRLAFISGLALGIQRNTLLTIQMQPLITKAVGPDGIPAVSWKLARQRR
jgi:hypothetical protein